MSGFKRLFSETAIYGGSTILARFLNYLLVFFHTRYYSTAEYGSVSNFYAYSSFLAVLFTYGMETAYFRFSSTSNKPANVFTTSFTTLILSTLAMLGLGLGFAVPLTEFFRMGPQPILVGWMFIIIAFDTLSALPFARLRQQNQPIRFAAIRTLGIVVNVVLNVWFFYVIPQSFSNPYLEFLQPLTEWARDVYFDIEWVFRFNLISSGAVLLLLLPQWRWPGGRFDWEILKKMLPYALPLVLVGLAGMVNETLDRVLLLHLLPDENYARAQTGIYGACYKLSILLTLFVQAYRFAAEPFFFNQAKQADARQTYARLMNYFMAVVCGIFLLVVFYLDLWKYFIGEAFWDGLHVVPILLLANLFLGLYYNASIWYKLADKTGWGAIISSAGAVITLVLNWVLIPIMGYEGAAWTTLICYAFMAISCFITGQVYYPIPYHWKRMGLYFFLALNLYGVSLALHVCFEAWVGAVAMGANTLLLGLFCIIVLWKEKKLVI